MNKRLITAVGIAGMLAATSAAAQVTFYQRHDFRGRSLTVDHPVRNLMRSDFDDRAQSAIVDSGSWEVCEDVRFGGRCSVLQPGRYDSLAAMGLDDAVASVRPAGHMAQGYGGPPPRNAAAPSQYPPPPPARGGRLYNAPVTGVRAVYGPPEQRCWVERQDVPSGTANVPGAVIGGLIGGVLGHQVGEGRGNTAATVGGAIAGAAIGGNVNNRAGGTYGRDVQHCAEAPGNEQPDYWDVTYDFHGVEHHVQMTAPPGATIPVDRDGDPRL
jgi:uncharacterized protein YcfJ